MSWPKLTAWICGPLFALGLWGCGFEPLYASKGDSGTDTVAHMAAISIGPIADRAGQQLRNVLQDKLTPRGKPREALYRLNVSLEENRSNLIILQDATSTFAKMRITANYTLNDISTGKPLTRGRSESTTIFNIVESEFANLNAQADARARAVNQIGDDIRLRLGIFFRRNSVRQGS
jgi:LPS-assembly lipoprotein